MDLKSSNYIQPPPTFSSSQIHGHGGVRKGLNLKDLPKKYGKALSTPGRPVFSFSVGSSKWNDAEKWLISDQPQNHHLHGFVKSSGRKSISSGHEEKDKFTNEVEVEHPSKFKETSRSRDVGTEMTPLTSRCPTPFKTLSPPRHNTPASRSGPLVESLECHLAKLAPFDSNWTSKEEEEEDISKSLRHYEENREEEEKTKCCTYEKKQKFKLGWTSKMLKQSRKLEVKIQKMRSKFEDKLMRKMAIVHKKADELRAAAQLQTIQKVNEEAKKAINMQFNCSCACFPCNNLHP
ncbi:hypothetical protein L1987_53863 [Smallanthus sonchifolius]|uniref:Uncharacterized protein n=1 Tax=Smallanthus sonchifolius TaxID=185202 RepID=A0ACB9EXH2_9ASTR|nr:hypothetical protein L1987_53863 [Smallanthus sonchifolius]